MIAFSGVRSSCDMLARNSDFIRLACFQLDVLLLERLLEAFQLGHVARRGEHALQAAVAVVEGGGVVGHHGRACRPWRAR